MVPAPARGSVINTLFAVHVGVARMCRLRAFPQSRVCPGLALCGLRRCTRSIMRGSWLCCHPCRPAWRPELCASAQIGLGFKTPQEAVTGTDIDKKCPFTGIASSPAYMIMRLHVAASSASLGSALNAPRPRYVTRVPATLFVFWLVCID